MFNFFRKQVQVSYEVIYCYGSRPFISRTTVEAADLVEAHRKFDADPRFEKCTRISDAIMLSSPLE